jgi:predicted nucleic acid-binding Zn ribbon protein
MKRRFDSKAQPRPKRLVSAQELLKSVLGRTGYDATQYALFDLWDSLLGPEAQKARAVGVRDGRLYVEVDTPVRTHGLALRKRELLKKINAPFGGTPPLSDIIFRPGTPPHSDDKNTSRGNRPMV